jgi:hypothetical protein
MDIEIPVGVQLPRAARCGGGAASDHPQITRMPRITPRTTGDGREAAV